MKKKNRKYNHNTAIIIAVLIFFIFCIVALLGYFKMKSMNRRIQESEAKIADMEIRIQPSTGATEQTEYMKAIEFLENETEKYREFIQEQQEYLIWLVGVVGAAFLALMTFFGIESRKNISDMLQERYAKLVKDEIAEVIGGVGREEYLVKCVEKEKQAKEKIILFLKQQEKDEDFEKIYDFLEKQEYCVMEEVIKESVKEKEINRLIEKCNVVIYQVGKSEYEKDRKVNRQAAGITDTARGANTERATVGETDINVQGSVNGETGTSEEKNYEKIARKCNEKGVYGIFYCVGGNRINLGKCNFPFYVSSVNFGATLLERINSVLYFTQE